MFQLQVIVDGQLVDCSWPPRSFQSVLALYRYYTRTWPNNSYWINPIS